MSPIWPVPKPQRQVQWDIDDHDDIKDSAKEEHEQDEHIRAVNKPHLSNHKSLRSAAKMKVYYFSSYKSMLSSSRHSVQVVTVLLVPLGNV